MATQGPPPATTLVNAVDNAALQDAAALLHFTTASPDRGRSAGRVIGTIDEVELRIGAAKRQRETISILLADQGHKLVELNRRAAAVVHSWQLRDRLGREMHVVPTTAAVAASVPRKVQTQQLDDSGEATPQAKNSVNNSADNSPENTSGVSPIPIARTTGAIGTTANYAPAAPRPAHPEARSINSRTNVMSIAAYTRTIVPLEHAMGAEEALDSSLGSLPGMSEEDATPTLSSPMDPDTAASLAVPATEASSTDLPHAKYVVRFPKSLLDADERMEVDAFSAELREQQEQLHLLVTLDQHEAKSVSALEETLLLLKYSGGRGAKVATKRTSPSPRRTPDRDNNQQPEQQPAEQQKAPPAEEEREAEKEDPAAQTEPAPVKSQENEKETTATTTASEPAKEEKPAEASDEKQNAPAEESSPKEPQQQEEDGQKGRDAKQSDAPVKEKRAPAESEKKEEAAAEPQPEEESTKPAATQEEEKKEEPAQAEREEEVSPTATEAAPASKPEEEEAAPQEAQAQEDGNTDAATDKSYEERCTQFWSQYVPKEFTTSEAPTGDRAHQAEQGAALSGNDRAAAFLLQTLKEQKEANDKAASEKQAAESANKSKEAAENSLADEKKARQDAEEDARHLREQLQAAGEREVVDAVDFHKEKDAREAAEKRVEELEKKAKELEAELLAIKEERTVLAEADKRALVEREARLANMESALTTSDELRAAQRETIDKLGAALDDSSARTKAAEERSSASDAKIAAAEEEIRRLNDECEASHESVTTLRELVSSNQVQHKAQMSVLLNRLEEQESEILDARAAARDMRAQADIQSSVDVIPRHNRTESERVEEVHRQQEWLVGRDEAARLRGDEGRRMHTTRGFSPAFRRANPNAEVTPAPRVRSPRPTRRQPSPSQDEQRSDAPQPTPR